VALEVGLGGRIFNRSPLRSVVKETAMSTPNVESIRTRLETVIALARQLERFEQGACAVDAGQYQLLITQLKAALSVDLPYAALRSVLGGYPAAAELHENLHYEQSGLSRSSLDRSVSSEMLTVQLLARLAKAAKLS
jgi:hypothetical protein